MWVAVLSVASAIWIFVPSQIVGWDLAVIHRAITSLREGRDPYVDCLLAQRAYFAKVSPSATASPPFSYVYSPVTLPLLRAVGRFPLALSGSIYWCLSAAGEIVLIWLGLQLADARERRILAVLAPALMFFPGLLESGILVGGNVAYPLYGCLFAAAWVGWRRGHWTWFYLAALLASCFKVTMLSTLAIPILSDRRQWLPSSLAGIAGLALFCLQPVLFPQEFRYFMQTLAMMFNQQHDYSGSPAGLLAGFFYGGQHFQLIFVLVYLTFSLPTVYVLRRLSLHYFEGDLSFRQWVPVMLLGAMLLNPRINEYDAAAITLPMALVAWRVLHRALSGPRAVRTLVIFFLATNIMVAVTAPSGPVIWKCTQCILLLSFFWLGARMLLRELGEKSDAQSAARAEQAAIQHVLQSMEVSVEIR